MTRRAGAGVTAGRGWVAGAWACTGGRGGGGGERREARGRRRPGACWQWRPTQSPSPVALDEKESRRKLKKMKTGAITLRSRGESGARHSTPGFQTGTGPATPASAPSSRLVLLAPKPACAPRRPPPCRPQPAFDRPGVPDRPPLGSAPRSRRVQSRRSARAMTYTGRLSLGHSPENIGRLARSPGPPGRPNHPAGCIRPRQPRPFGPRERAQRPSQEHTRPEPRYVSSASSIPRAAYPAHSAGTTTENERVDGNSK